jgi:hypothetical protein
MFELKDIEAKPIANFFQCINIVNDSAVVHIGGEHMFSRVVDKSNALYAILRVPSVPSVPEVTELALPIDRIAASLPTTGTINLKYDGTFLIAQSGKSKYKFQKYATGMYMMPKELKLTIPISVSGVKTADIAEAITKIRTYYTKEAYNPKVGFRFNKDGLSISDYDENVTTDIDAVTCGDDINIYLSYDYISMVMGVVKKVTDVVDLGAIDASKPLMISGTGFTYYIAPMLVGEDE